MINKLIAAVITLAGVCLVVNPELVVDGPVPEDPFEAIERRIRWGLLLGLGVFLLLHRTIRPWQTFVLAVAAAITFGILCSRLVGLALDVSATEQWFWVCFEIALLTGLLLAYRRFKLTHSALVQTDEHR